VVALVRYIVFVVGLTAILSHGTPGISRLVTVNLDLFSLADAFIPLVASFAKIVYGWDNLVTVLLLLAGLIDGAAVLLFAPSTLLLRVDAFSVCLEEDKEGIHLIDLKICSLIFCSVELKFDGG
jgi:hypothetical protein